MPGKTKTTDSATRLVSTLYEHGEKGAEKAWQEVFKKNSGTAFVKEAITLIGTAQLNNDVAIGGGLFSKGKTPLQMAEKRLKTAQGADKEIWATLKEAIKQGSTVDRRKRREQPRHMLLTAEATTRSSTPSSSSHSSSRSGGTPPEDKQGFRPIEHDHDTEKRLRPRSGRSSAAPSPSGQSPRHSPRPPSNSYVDDARREAVARKRDENRQKLKALKGKATDPEHIPTYFHGV